AVAARLERRVADRAGVLGVGQGLGGRVVQRQRRQLLGAGGADQAGGQEGHGGQQAGLDQESTAGSVDAVHLLLLGLRRLLRWLGRSLRRSRPFLVWPRSRPPHPRAHRLDCAAMSTLPYDPARLAARAADIVAATAELAALGWTPATSSNCSLRLDERHVAITLSGRAEGRPREADIIGGRVERRP